MLAESRPTLSAKAFLATEQRFPGIGNGTLQDILFAARIHPKRKIASLTEDERERLAACTASVLGEMTRLGGRDTEKDLFGNPGGYQTRMSKRTLAAAARPAAARSRRRRTSAARSTTARAVRGCEVDRMDCRSLHRQDRRVGGFLPYK